VYAKMCDLICARSVLVRLLVSGMTFPQEQEARALLAQLQGKVQ